MSDKKTFLMLLCGMMTMMMYPVVVCMEQNKEIISYKDIAKNILVGSCTGVAEVIVNQPLIYFKNMLQQGKRISLNPKIAYRGLGVGVACMAPTTAVQFGVEKGLQNIFPGAETIPTTLRSVSAGAFSALVSSPTELIVLHQQNSGMHSWKTIRTLVGQEGICVLSRGMLAKSLRDSVFCTGLLSLYPMLEQKISADVVNNKPIATITAGVIAGGITAVVSHPFDTISTLMQSDYNKKLTSTMRRTVIKLYQEEGMYGFFKGVTPRGTRVVLAIPLMNKVKNDLNNVIGSQQKEE